MTDSSDRRRGGRAWRSALLAPAVALFVAAVALSSGAPARGQDVDSERVDPGSLREEYEALVGEEADLLVAYDQTEERLAELFVATLEAQQSLEAADAALVDAEASLDEANVVEEAATAALDATRAEVGAAEDQVRAFAVGAYVLEGGLTEATDLLAMLEGDPAALVRRGNRRAVDREQGRVIDRLEAARDEADRLQVAAAEARQRSADERDVVQVLQEQAAAALDEQARLLAESEQQRQAQALLLADVQSRRLSIEARITSLERAADGIEAVLAAFQANDPDWTPGAVHFQGPLPCTPIGSEFGMRSHPILSVTRLHAGADIGAAMGQPVEAAADGVVVLAEVRGGYGNTVVIAHGHSLGTVYAHNSSLLVSAGDLVTRGDVIAHAGSTGLSSGPHVHFETRLRGVPLDPRRFLLPSEGGTGVPGPEPSPPPPGSTTTTTEPIGAC